MWACLINNESRQELTFVWIVSQAVWSLASIEPHTSTGWSTMEAFCYLEGILSKFGSYFVQIRYQEVFLFTFYLKSNVFSLPQQLDLQGAGAVA